jgi:hypothetical protein
MSLVAIGLTTYVTYHVSAPSGWPFPISVLAILAGVMFDGRRLSAEWSAVLLNALIFSCFSLTAFSSDMNQ